MEPATESMLWSIGAIVGVIIVSGLVLKALIFFIPLAVNLAILWAVGIRAKALWKIHGEKYLLCLIPGAFLPPIPALYTLTVICLFSAVLTEILIRLPKNKEHGSLFAQEFS